MARVAGDGVAAPFAAVAGKCTGAYVTMIMHVLGHPVEEIIGIWEKRDEYLGRIYRGRRMGIGPEPDNRHINTGNTINDFAVKRLSDSIATYLFLRSES